MRAEFCPKSLPDLEKPAIMPIVPNWDAMWRRAQKLTIDSDSWPKARMTTPFRLAEFGQLRIAHAKPVKLQLNPIGHAVC
jgi:hypothetical protein